MLVNVPCEKIEENFSVSILVIVIMFHGSNTMTEKVCMLLVKISKLKVQNGCTAFTFRSRATQMFLPT